MGTGEGGTQAPLTEAQIEWIRGILALARGGSQAALSKRGEKAKPSQAGDLAGDMRNSDSAPGPMAFSPNPRAAAAVQPDSNPPPAALDPNALPTQVGGPDWHSSADLINAAAPPYGTIYYMKVQAANINRLMIPLQKALSAGEAAAADLPKRMKAMSAAVKPIEQYLKDEGKTAMGLVAKFATPKLVQDAKIANVAEGLKDLEKAFVANIRTQIANIENGIDQATTELESTHFREKALEARKSAESASGAIEVVLDGAKEAVEGGLEGGPEGAAKGAAISVAKSVLKIIIDNKVQENVEELEEAAITLHKESVTKWLAGANRTLNDLTKQCGMLANGQSVGAAVADGYKGDAMDHFDKENHSDKDPNKKCPFQFTPVLAAVDAAEKAVEVATTSLQSWQEAERLVTKMKEQFGIFEVLNAAGEFQSIDGYVRPNSPAGLEGRIEGPEADKMRAAQLDDFNSQITGAITDDATKNSDEANKRHGEASESLTKLQSLRDQAFEALATSHK